MLFILVGARAIEAIVGPASAIVEMIGHRVLPLVNSFIAIALWIGIALWLVPIHGPLGMTFDNLVVRVDPSFKLEVHIDTDEGNACGLKPDTFCELLR